MEDGNDTLEADDPGDALSAIFSALPNAEKLASLPVYQPTPCLPAPFRSNALSQAERQRLRAWLEDSEIK